MGVDGHSRVWMVGAGVLFCQLGLDVEDVLAEDGEIVEGVGGAAIHSRAGVRNAWRPSPCGRRLRRVDRGIVTSATTGCRKAIVYRE